MTEAEKRAAEVEVARTEAPSNDKTAAETNGAAVATRSYFTNITSIVQKIQLSTVLYVGSALGVASIAYALVAFGAKKLVRSK